MSDVPEMVERVAWAIGEALKMPGEFFRTQDELCEAARKVIAAMREPTEAHVAAFENNGGSYRLRGRPDLKDVWRAMIDAALKKASA